MGLSIFKDILTQLNLVSKAFQKDQVHYGDARDVLDSVKAGFTTCYLGPQGFVGGDTYGQLAEATPKEKRGSSGTPKPPPLPKEGSRQKVIP